MDKEISNELRYMLRTGKLHLPMSMDEAVYVRGALKSAIRLMKQGDEREFTLKVLDRLDTAIFDLKSYEDLPF